MTNECKFSKDVLILLNKSCWQSLPTCPLGFETLVAQYTLFYEWQLLLKPKKEVGEII